MTFLQQISNRKKQGIKSLAVLIDPDSIKTASISQLVKLAENASVDFFFIGGSTVTYEQMDEVVTALKSLTKIPLIIFPGSTSQLHPDADALLYLSLISGRNPEYLISKHIESIPFIRTHNIEVVPTGYVLVDGGNRSSVAYISQTEPIPVVCEDIILNTALAGQYLGMQLIYLEAGSGAVNHIPISVVKKAAGELNVPLIVGGGIRDPHTAQALCNAGADLIVIGNALEKEPELLTDLSIAVHSRNRSLNFL